MSATAPETQGVRTSTYLAVLGVAALLVLRLLLSGGDGDLSWSDVIASAVFTAAAAVIGLGLVLPRAQRTPPGTAASAAAVLAGLSVVALLFFFFSGAPFVLGASTTVLARSPAAAGAPGRRRAVAGAVGTVVMVLSLIVAALLTASGFDPGMPR